MLTVKKNLDTLSTDIGKVLKGEKPWTKVNSLDLSNNLEILFNSRLAEETKERNFLSMSSLGESCNRKSWLICNSTLEREPLNAETLFKFMYGDLLEEVVLELAKAAGHSVEGCQDKMELDGIKGHRDAVINGVTVDVKTASSWGFKKFKDHTLRDDDPFGYISQLSSYVAAAKDDPLVTDKTGGAFLVINKETGEIIVDYYDFTDEIANKSTEVLMAKGNVMRKEPPDVIEPVPMGKSGNMKLDTKCRYCQFKWHCHPTLRVFEYSNGPVYLTKVVKEPYNVKEIT